MDSIQKLISRINIPVKTVSFEEILEDEDVKAFVATHNPSRSVLNNSKSRLNEFVLAKKRVNETGLIPELFLNINFIDVRYAQSPVLLEQKRQAKLNGLFKTNTVGKNMITADFSDVHFTIERKELIMAIQKFANAYIKNPNGSHQGLFVSGGYGIGKSYILSAMGRTLSQKGFEVRMEHFPTFINRLHAHKDFSDKVIEIDLIKKTPILILDDFGSETMTSWLRDGVILVILEYRMANDLPTFMTSNLRLKDVPAYLAKAREGVDELKAQRIMQRVQFLMSEIYLTGQNRRFD